MKKVTGGDTHLKRSPISLDEQFSAFTSVMDSFGLMSFVSFVMHKNFEHTNMACLSDRDKEILMEECQPLLDEAVAQTGSIQ